MLPRVGILTLSRSVTWTAGGSLGIPLTDISFTGRSVVPHSVSVLLTILLKTPYLAIPNQHPTQ